MSRYLSQLMVLAILSVSGPAAACVAEWALEQKFDVRGDAHTLDGIPLYTEYLAHRPDGQGGKLTVRYTTPQGAPIADKDVEYRCNATTPSFRLVDHNTGEVEGVNWKEGIVETFQGEEMKRIDPPPGPAIVDSGFDNAIKLHWDELIEGNDVTFHYLFPRNGSFLKLRLRQSEAPPALANEGNDNTVFFTIAANNLFLRALSKPIFVGYDKDTRSLRYYLGPSNLPTMRENKVVLIRYAHLETENGVKTLRLARVDGDS